MSRSLPAKMAVDIYIVSKVPPQINYIIAWQACNRENIVVFGYKTDFRYNGSSLDNNVI